MDPKISSLVSDQLNNDKLLDKELTNVFKKHSKKKRTKKLAKKLNKLNNKQKKQYKKELNKRIKKTLKKIKSHKDKKGKRVRAGFFEWEDPLEGVESLFGDGPVETSKLGAEAAAVVVASAAGYGLNKFVRGCLNMD